MVTRHATDREGESDVGKAFSRFVTFYSRVQGCNYTYEAILIVAYMKAYIRPPVLAFVTC